MKRILVLGAGEGQIPLITRAKMAGWHVIAASPQGNYPGFEIADECVFADIADKEAILSIAKKCSADAVATDQTDVSVSSLQYVTERLNLPHIECKDIDNFRIKSLMRSVCEQSGIPSIPYCVTSDFATASSFYFSLSGNAIIKPDDSQGSRGVHQISSKEDLYDAFYDALRYSKSGSVIIEKFIEGHEIEVDTIIQDGQIRATIIGDVFKFGLKDTFSSYERIYPSALGIKHMENVRIRNGQVLHALGLVTGWSHGEYIVDNEGEVYLLEVGARGGGNFVGSDIVRMMCGISSDEMAFRTAIGDSSFYENIMMSDCFCGLKCFYLPEGIVSSVSISEDFYNKEYVVSHNLGRIFVGMRVFPNTDKTSRFTIVLKADTREQLHRCLQEVMHLISIEVTSASGDKLGIIWK